MRTQQVVEGWIETVDAGAWRATAPSKPVAIYADRSGSMRGFLDPSYPTRTDYRSLIDGLQARLSPGRIYGFGNRVRLEAGAGLDVLGDRDFYTDGNTELEQVVDTIAADTSRGWSHIVIGDGRRTDPNLAHRQFVRMRELGLQWTAGGGTFLMAVSRAPFRPVRGDPSGCHLPESGAAVAGDSLLTCPLYVFAFAAPGDGMWLAATFSDLFDHLWAFPIPTAPVGSLEIRQTVGVEGTTFDPVWLPSGGSASVPLVQAETPATRPITVTVEMSDRAAPNLGALLAGERTRAVLWARTVTDDEPPPEWGRQQASSGSVRVSDDGRELQVFSPGGDACLAVADAEPCGTLYRLDLLPVGRPAWLAQFEASDAADREGTFGLGRLFEPFAVQARQAVPLAQVYLLVR
jgi:hypothetical protein